MSDNFKLSVSSATISSTIRAAKCCLNSTANGSAKTARNLTSKPAFTAPLSQGPRSFDNPFACEPCRAARNTDSVRGRGVAAIIHKAIYGKDDSPNHADNRDDADFQKGYARATELILKKGACDTTIEILLEWKRRGQPRADAPDFKSWKRGLSAASMQQAASKNL